MTLTPPPKSAHAQSLLNNELLQFVRQRGTAPWLDLFNAFGEGSYDSKMDRHRFGKKLEYLVYTGRLQSTGIGTKRVFILGPDACLPVPARGRTNAQAGQCSGVAVLTEALNPQLLQFASQLVVPPRQYDAMHGDPYTHVLAAPARPGALDFKRHPSHGHQC